MSSLFRVNVVIPMAGEGSRFSAVGYYKTKPFIDVAGKPMIQWVFDNIESSKVDLQFIVIIRKEHDVKFNMSNKIREIKSNVKIVYADKLTEGAACTTLLAEQLYNNETPLFIINSDQFLEWDSSKYWEEMIAEQNSTQGNIVCFKIPIKNNDIKWSYAAIDTETNYVIDVQEKKVISENATVGAYYWRRGADYVKYAKQMIQQNIRVNNEFYVAPVYNQAIKDGYKFSLSFCDKMWGLGVPADLTSFLYNFVRTKRHLNNNSIYSVDQLNHHHEMKFIAHRGNLNGINKSKENRPEYLMAAKAQGFDVELDVWYFSDKNKWLLGHDQAEYEIELEFLLQSGLWIHCKNGEALHKLQSIPQSESLNIFFHNIDDFTLTSRGFLWTYPNKPIYGNKSIAVMFDKPDQVILTNPHMYGICADNVAELRELWKQQQQKTQEFKIHTNEQNTPYIENFSVLTRLSGRTKAIIFDLDGVLVESKDLHYEALNMALNQVAGPEYVINQQEHESIYDGLSTNQKLILLERAKKLHQHLHMEVFLRKQEITLELFNTHVKQDKAIQETLAGLKYLGFSIAVASNCIRASVIALLDGIGAMPYVDAFFSNEDVKNAKPAPDIYIKAASCFACNPSEVLVIEDTPKGWEAAIRAGANLFKVKSPESVRLTPILNHINLLENNIKPGLNIVFPLARSTQQYWLDGPDHLSSEVPLQLADVNGRPLLQLLCENILPANLVHSDSGINNDYLRSTVGQIRFIFLVRENHVNKFQLNSLLPRITNYFPTTVVPVHCDQLGAVKTCLLAETLINNSQPLMIADGGHYVRWDKGVKGVIEMFQAISANTADACVTVHESSDPRWSYVQLAASNSTVANSSIVVSCREKVRVSSHACTGLYYWSKGSDFVSIAQETTKNPNKTVRGQYYLSTLINEAIENSHKKVIAYFVDKNWSIRNTTELNKFQSDILPERTEKQMKLIYEEMIQRNNLNSNGTKADKELFELKDNRFCQAGYTMFTNTNWEPKNTFNTLMNELAQTISPGNQCFYSVLSEEDSIQSNPLVGALHWTLMQFIRFDLNAVTPLPGDYYQTIQAILVNCMNTFEICFDRICITPASILMLGTPTLDLNSCREYLRKELSRIGYPVFEPYKVDIVHSTLVRFSTLLNKEQEAKLLEIEAKYNGKYLGKLVVDSIMLSAATWRMKSKELNTELGLLVKLPVSLF